MPAAAARPGRPTSTRRSRTPSARRPRPRATASRCPTCRRSTAQPMNACRRSSGCEHWIERAFAARLVAVDTETSSLDAMQRRPRRGQPGAGAERCLLHPAAATAAATCLPKTPSRSPLAAAIAALKPLLESEAVLKVGQNIKYDINVLARHDIAVGPVDDTMVISFDTRRRAADRRDRRRARDGRTGRAPPRPHHADLQGSLRHRQEGDSRSARCRSTKATAICRRGCRRDLAAAPRAQAAPAARRRARGFTSGSTAR